MAVTSNVGLVAPSESELAKEWIVAPNQWNALNNLTIIDHSTITLQSYTPAWIADITNPTVGDSTITGEYFDVEGFIFGGFTIIAGSTFNKGLGEYGFSLPTPVSLAYHTSSANLTATPGIPTVIGEGYITDVSQVDKSGTVAVDSVTLSGVSYARMITEAYTGKINRFFSSDYPFGVVAGDQFSANFMYKAA